MAKEDKNSNKGGNNEPEKPAETPVEFMASLASVLVTGLFIITFIVQTFVIPSSSMEDTLLIGDHVFVNRIQFSPRTKWLGPLLPYRDLKHDEIAVFMSPAQPGLYLVKRIIGLPGDRIHLKDGAVYRNGQLLNQSFVRHKRPEAANPYSDNFPTFSAPPTSTEFWAAEISQHIKDGEIEVPADSYFAMGDNRDVSYDSRYWGFIPRENLIGRPLLIYWSFDTNESDYTKTDWLDRVKSLGSTVLHFFDQTRWRRTLQVVR